jgi:hypothetical protein
MFCTQCGARYSQDMNFCTGCGQQFVHTTAAFHSVRVSDLPDMSRSRLLAALKDVPSESFVLNESRHWLAMIALAGTFLGIGYVISQADSYKWQSESIFTNLAILMTCFAAGSISATYLIKCVRSDFKARVLLNPLYFLRFRFDRIDAITLPLAQNWAVKHHSDSRGVYNGATFCFQADGLQRTFSVDSIRSANEIVGALNRYPSLVSNLVQAQDSARLYSLDLLYEWRRREESFPRTTKVPTGVKYVLYRFGPALLAATVGALMFFFTLVPYNDSCDDDLRWNTAFTTRTATAYRLYIASRPDGRHSNEAHAAISALYDKTANSYRTSAGLESEGIEAVIKILEYAKATGHYKVLVNFSDDNEIPPNIDERLRSVAGFSRIVPVLPSFTEQMNRAREDRILERITKSFGKVIPGDILQFAIGASSGKDPVFNVDYKIKTSGEVYYPEKQEHLPEANRDWYTGVSFRWKFNIAVPDSTDSRFQFSLDSRPADLFNVAYQQAGTGSTELSPIQVYGAMADSAFDDFGSKLLTELSVN